MEGKSECKNGRSEIVEKTYYTKDEAVGIVRGCALCALRKAHQSRSGAVAFCLYTEGVLNLEKRIEDELCGENAEGGSGD